MSVKTGFTQSTRCDKRAFISFIVHRQQIKQTTFILRIFSKKKTNQNTKQTESQQKLFVIRNIEKFMRVRRSELREINESFDRQDLHLSSVCHLPRVKSAICFFLLFPAEISFHFTLSRLLFLITSPKYFFVHCLSEIVMSGKREFL